MLGRSDLRGGNFWCGDLSGGGLGDGGLKDGGLGDGGLKDGGLGDGGLENRGSEQTAVRLAVLVSLHEVAQKNIH